MTERSILLRAKKSPLVMGVLNVTPDSFSDGGDFFLPEKALQQGLKMVAEGAAIIDVGGESTRPNASPVSAEQELDRVLPVIEALHSESPVTISIDTSKSEVMTAAVAAGADLINDVRALQLPGAMQAAVQANVPVCLMHMQGQPETMQQQPKYEHVVQEVKTFLLERVQQCEEAGIKSENIAIDPGFGFGKSLAHNLSLMKYLHEICELGFPVLVGVSRKSMIGAVLDADTSQRFAGSLALASIALWQGCSILRVHDVRATADAVKMISAVMKSK